MRFVWECRSARWSQRGGMTPVPGHSQLIAETLNNAALCQYKMGQYKAVVGTSTLLLKSDPTNISALLRRGLVSE